MRSTHHWLVRQVASLVFTVLVLLALQRHDGSYWGPGSWLTLLAAWIVWNGIAALVRRHRSAGESDSTTEAPKR